MGKGLRLLILGVIAAGRLWADPVDLEAPSNSLGASDLYGNVKIWREIGEVDFGKGLELPLRVGFSSAEQRSSPYAGKGWTVPLLESVAFLKREKMMEVILLCGKTLYLRRDEKTPSKFQTLEKEWTGVMEGDQITISRPDGWELQYRQGKLQRMKTDTGRVLTWVYNGNLVSEIREEGVGATSPLQVVMSSGGKIPTGMMVNGKLHRFDLEKRPLIKSEGGAHVVEQLDPSLAAWTWPDGKKETYEFGATPEVMPTLKVTDREGQASDYAWDPANGHILSAEGWTYHIGGISKPFEMPRIERTDAKGEKEFTTSDLKTGITDRQTLEDGRRITQVFSSPGNLYGKVRKVETVDAKGNKTPILQLSYDEQGRLFRKIDESGFATVFDYAKDGKLTGEHVLPPSDPEVLKRLQGEEQQLKQTLSLAKYQSDKDAALRDLFNFYALKMRDYTRARLLISQMKSEDTIFGAEYVLVSSNSKNKEERKQLLLKMLERFPSKRTFLQSEISD